MGHLGGPWASECSAWGGGCEEVPQSQGHGQSLEPSVQGLPPPRLWSRRLLVGLCTSHALLLRLQRVRCLVVLQAMLQAVLQAASWPGPAQGRPAGQLLSLVKFQAGGNSAVWSKYFWD